jgi:hypothetical protein
VFTVEPGVYLPAHGFGIRIEDEVVMTDKGYKLLTATLPRKLVNSQPGEVFVLGHSLGALCALEAALLTDKISKLVLYEPPLQTSIIRM